jgi:hypothetical protein
MGVEGIEASASAPPRTTLRQPSDGERAKQPQIEVQEERAEHEHTGRFSWRAERPLILVMALVEIAWLVALGYLFH